MRKGIESGSVAIGGSLFAVAFSYPALLHPNSIGVVWDWPEFLTRNYVAYREILEWHLPLWNPYSCGGMPLLGHPSSGFLSPMFLLSLAFGPFVGTNFSITCHILAAWLGCYWLGKVLGMGETGRVACACVFPSSSWFYLHIAVGHLNFLPFCYMPWLLGAVISGREVWAAATLALMFFEGGVYTVTQSLILIALIRPKSIIKVLLLAALFAAPKLIPSAWIMYNHPRGVQDYITVPLMDIFRGLFRSDQYYDGPRLNLQIGFWESGFYISPAFALLTCFSSGCRNWWILAVLLLLVSTGSGPWYLLHMVPIFASERMPQRFMITFVLVVGILVGYGTDRIGKLSVPILLIACLDCWLVSRPNFYASTASPLTPVVQMPYAHVCNDPWDMLNVARSGRDALHCNEELDFRNGWTRCLP